MKKPTKAKAAAKKSAPKAKDLKPKKDPKGGYSFYGSGVYKNK